MDPIFIAKNAGAKVCIFDKYITLKKSFLSSEITIPIKEISAVEEGIISIKIITKDRKDYTVSLKSKDKKLLMNVIRSKISE
jgi:hypothetical protein